MRLIVKTLPALLLAAAIFSGCTKDGGREEEKDAKPKAPQVAGKWTGTWESASDKRHSGGLSCEATSAKKNEWEAVFTAEFGKTKAYTVKLKGKPQGDKVVFGGEVDLGKADGGVFTWTGRATETEFTGEYQGGGDTGSFKMTREAKK